MKGKKPAPPKTQKPNIKEKKPAVEKKDGVKQILLDMKKEILTQVPEKSAAELHDATKETDDEAAMASIETSREVYLLLTVRNRQRLRGIEDALKKIETGTFGICEECGEKIEPVRLKAMPLARLCLDCQAQLEKEYKLQKTIDSGPRIPFVQDEAEE